jgi:hypothetical protein
MQQLPTTSINKEHLACDGPCLGWTLPGPRMQHEIAVSNQLCMQFIPSQTSDLPT